jgi:hypothetical protein
MTEETKATKFTTKKSLGAWSDECIDILKVEWEKGTVASKIGILIQKSRGAVIGKAHRLNLSRRAPANGYSGMPKKERPPQAPRVRATRTNTAIVNKKQVPPRFYASAVPLTDKPPISIMELRYNTCRAIVGRGKDGLAVYCGDMTFYDKAFCEGHCAMYYQPPEARQRYRQ